MAITGVLRSSLFQLRVLDMDKALDHYVRLIGLSEVGRTDDGRVLLKAMDEFDHHSLVLREAETAGMDLMGFKVSSPEVLDQYEAATKEFGLPLEVIEPNTD